MPDVESGRAGNFALWGQDPTSSHHLSQLVACRSGLLALINETKLSQIDSEVGAMNVPVDGHSERGPVVGLLTGMSTCHVKRL
jgi:hypothetical protein